ncbi:MAG: hypothetical protein Q9210_004113 [Variospora velana]
MVCNDAGNIPVKSKWDSTTSGKFRRPFKRVAGFGYSSFTRYQEADKPGPEPPEKLVSVTQEPTGGVWALELSPRDEAKDLGWHVDPHRRRWGTQIHV